VHVLRTPLAETAFGILLADQELQALLDDLAEAQALPGIRRVREHVLGKLRVARTEERQHGQARHAHGGVLVSGSGALESGAAAVVVRGAPAPVGRLVAGEPLERREHRGLGRARAAAAGHEVLPATEASAVATAPSASDALAH